MLSTAGEEQIVGSLHELSVGQAAVAIRSGALTSEAYAEALLDRCRQHEDLRAFITLSEADVLAEARKADKKRSSGVSLGPLHGVPIAIKDSINTRGTPTSLGTSILSKFTPDRDAGVVTALREAGAILFGKNNLVEMSYGLMGTNAHHGQPRNPYDKGRVTGGSSSGAGAAVAARLVPAAIGGDTVGSIRVPSSLCGVVGFRPSSGRWPSDGIAPIASTFDTAGPMARTVEDCALIDSVMTRDLFDASGSSNLKGVRLGYAPKQHLDLIDPDVERAFRAALQGLSEAGAEIVEVNFQDDFSSLVLRANWRVFRYETMPHITRHLEISNMPVTFREIYEQLGPDVKHLWDDAVMPGGPNVVSDLEYDEAIKVIRPELMRQYAELYSKNRIDALLLPSTPTVAPPISSVSEIEIAGQLVHYRAIGRNVIPSSCAGLPGINLPIGLSAGGLPIGLEIDGQQGRDTRLLEIAMSVSKILGQIPAPSLAE